MERLLSQLAEDEAARKRMRTRHKEDKPLEKAEVEVEFRPLARFRLEAYLYLHRR